ncbi:Predicted kinase, aminoglycoside phosphotransferase (APT) family [Sphingobium faniae]|nr:Predicted kinase, aminoglycoside phosphotransferase (APT) family [Sphingobium faniae]
MIASDPIKISVQGSCKRGSSTYDSMTHDTGALLRVIARDLEQIVLPNIAVPNVQTLVGMMKSLLEREAGQMETPDEVLSPPAGSGLPELIASAEAQLSRALAGETTSRDGAWAESGAGRSAAQSSDNVRLSAITADQITAYLRKLPDWNWVKEARVSQTAGGFSKDTFIVTVTGDGREDGMVLRRDQAFRPLLTSVTDEWPVLASLAALGFPAPRPLWIEKDSAIFGASVIALERASGSADSAQWSGEEERRANVVRSSARLLAQLHAIPAAQAGSAGSGVPGSNGASPAEFAADLARYWDRIAPAPNPLMDAVLSWLADAAPERFERRAIVHGDYGLHNLLVDGEDIRAVLDWEFWHIGDPREDLAYIKPFMDQIGAWDIFLAAYQDAGGLSSDAKTEQFYAVLSSVRVAMGCYALQHGFGQRTPTIDSKMIYVGRSFADRFLIDAARIAAGGGQ